MTRRNPVLKALAFLAITCCDAFTPKSAPTLSRISVRNRPLPRQSRHRYLSVAGSEAIMGSASAGAVSGSIVGGPLGGLIGGIAGGMAGAVSSIKKAPEVTVSAAKATASAAGAAASAAGSAASDAASVAGAAASAAGSAASGAATGTKVAATAVASALAKCGACLLAVPGQCLDVLVGVYRAEFSLQSITLAAWTAIVKTALAISAFTVFIATTTAAVSLECAKVTATYLIFCAKASAIYVWSTLSGAAQGAAGGVGKATGEMAALKAVTATGSATKTATGAAAVSKLLALPWVPPLMLLAAVVAIKSPRFQTAVNNLQVQTNLATTWSKVESKLPIKGTSLGSRGGFTDSTVKSIPAAIPVKKIA